MGDKASIRRPASPTINPEAHYGVEPVLVAPGPGGGHNWFPMAFNPDTKLAYLPIYEHWLVYALDPDFQPKTFRSNGGWGGYSGEALKKRLELQKIIPEREKTFLLAWDPVKQKAAWKVQLAAARERRRADHRWQSRDRGHDAPDVRDLPRDRRQAAVGNACAERAGVRVRSPSWPNGEQYIAVNAGWGGGAAQIERGVGIAQNRASARLLVFKLGGAATLPPLAEQAAVPDPPPLRATEEQIQRGAKLFADTCSRCHGILAVGGVKDLRVMSREAHAEFNDVVLKGTRTQKGMASFANLITPADAEAIHAYVISRAHEDWGALNAHPGAPAN